MQEAIKNNKVMLWGLKKIDSKLLGPYEKKYIPPIEKRGRPKKELDVKKTKKKEFDLEEDYGVEDLEFLKSESDRIDTDLNKKDIPDELYEELTEKQDKIYDLIEVLEGLKKISLQNQVTGHPLRMPEGQSIQINKQPIEVNMIGGLIIEGDKFKCPICDVSFDTKQKMERHIKTKKHEANLKKNNIINVKDYNDNLLKIERRKRVVKKIDDEPKKKTIKKLLPYFFIGEVPEGYREATELEALESGKYSEYGKKKIDNQRFKDFSELGQVFNDKLDEREMFLKTVGIRGRMQRLTKEHSKIVNRHGFNKLTKGEQERLTSEANVLNKRFERLGDFYNRYSKILMANKGKPYIDIKFNINTTFKQEKEITIPIPYSDKKPSPEPLKPIVETLKQAPQAQKIEKSKIIEKNELVYYCDGKPDLVMSPKHFLKTGKIKSTTAERLYKLNIRLEKELYTDLDYKKYFYRVKGTGLFTRFLEYFKKGRTGSKGFSQSTQKALNQIGNDPIKSITIMRAPITSQINSLLNTFSFGDFQKRLDETPYDKLFHLSIIVNGNIIVEKLELINVQIVSSGGSITGPDNEGTEDLSQPEYKTLTYGFKPGMTINSLLENCREQMGDYKFYNYSGSTNNCQDFILNLLQANGLGNKEDYEFIKQDVETIFEGKDTLKTFMDYITGLKGIYTELTGGGIEQKIPLTGSRVQSVIFNKKQWTEEKAIEWLTKHNYPGLIVDKKINVLRYRQIEPSILKREGYKFRILTLPKGIQLVIGFQKHLTDSNK